MTEERQGPTLTIRFRKVSVLWTVKENDWTRKSWCPFKGGVGLTECQRKWLKNGREQLLVSGLGRCPSCRGSKKWQARNDWRTAGVLGRCVSYTKNKRKQQILSFCLRKLSISWRCSLRESFLSYGIFLHPLLHYSIPKCIILAILQIWSSIWCFFSPCYLMSF